MNKKKTMKIFLAIGTIIASLATGVMVYRYYTNTSLTKLLEKNDRPSIAQGGKQFRPNSLGRMIPLIEASQKVKTLDRLSFSYALGTQQVKSRTISDLIKSLTQEKLMLKRHIHHLKSQSRDSISTRKLRSYAYYIQVLEENIQDLEIILTNRGINKRSEQ